jgi:hypothetical protein
MPADARVDDLFHWQVLISGQASAVRAAALESGGHDVLPGASAAEALVRDRDGHALFVREARSSL